jgi:hypothetical protein
MSYQYCRLRSEAHRDVAHWRGARGGVRVLSLPSCSGWLQRQANDACYDFWPDLAIGTRLPPQQPADGGAAVPHAASATVLVLQKDAGGAWLIDPWRADQAGVMRPLAANGDVGLAVDLSRTKPTSGLNQSAGDPVGTGAGDEARQASASTRSFIIEIGGSAR